MMSSETDESTFYDVHMHAFNLSHPYLLAFVRRFKGKLGALLCFSPALPLLAKVPGLWPTAASGCWGYRSASASASASARRAAVSFLYLAWSFSGAFATMAFSTSPSISATSSRR